MKMRLREGNGERELLEACGICAGERHENGLARGLVVETWDKSEMCFGSQSHRTV